MGNTVKKNLDCTNCQTLATSVFCTLHRNDLQQLNQFKTSLFLKKGTTIFYEGNQPSGLYCVHQGKAKVYKTTEKGETQIMRLAKDGDVIGYKSLLANEPYTSTAETIEDSTVCFIPKQFVYEMLSKNLDLSLKIMGAMGKEIEEAQQKNLDMVHKNSKERLAEAVILLKESFGTDAEGYINIKLTREELASITGMAIETVVRILKEWEDEHLLMLDKKRIKITDQKEMVQHTQARD